MSADLTLKGSKIYISFKPENPNRSVMLERSGNDQALVVPDPFSDMGWSSQAKDRSRFSFEAGRKLPATIKLVRPIYTRVCFGPIQFPQIRRQAR